MTKSNEYLYGVGVVVPDIPEDVIKTRIRLLNNNLEEILKEGYLERDRAHMNDIIKALSYWANIQEH